MLSLKINNLNFTSYKRTLEVKIMYCKVSKSIQNRFYFYYHKFYLCLLYLSFLVYCIRNLIVIDIYIYNILYFYILVNVTITTTETSIWPSLQLHKREGLEN